MQIIFKTKKIDVGETLTFLIYKSFKMYSW